jgi:hypothetical protein
VSPFVPAASGATNQIMLPEQYASAHADYISLERHTMIFLWAQYASKD